MQSTSGCWAAPKPERFFRALPESRKITGQVALQVWCNGFGDLFDRQRPERIQFQYVARHHHADELGRNVLDADSTRPWRAVHPRADLYGYDILEERSDERGVVSRQDRAQRRDETFSQFGFPE